MVIDDKDILGSEGIGYLWPPESYQEYDQVENGMICVRLICIFN